MINLADLRKSYERDELDEAQSTDRPLPLFERWLAQALAAKLPEPTAMTLAPTPGTYLVKGGKGAVFKVQILSYYATPTGEVGASSAKYKLAVAAL